MADYGCGTGLRTIALMEQLSASHATGVDTDPNAIAQALSFVSQLQATHVPVLKGLPQFIVGDVVTGENLPSDVQIAFSRRLLTNLLGSSHHGAPSRLASALRNIAQSLAPGGYAMFIEEAAQHGDFTSALEHASLRVFPREQFRYKEKVIPMVRYVCIKSS
jgi:tRNA1(Val) A37 N6-methylase TrmN6